MNLPTRITKRIKDVGIDQMRTVWDAPATFNRKSRRAAGLFGRLWRWDMQALDPDAATRPPRYVRRHFGAIQANYDHPKTRRQRRHKARILKAMKGKLS